MRLCRFAVIAIALTLFVVVRPASAESIGVGHDLFMTVPGQTNLIVDAGPFGGTGFVEFPLEGIPFGPGNTDTIVERLDGHDFATQGNTATIQIELVALSLQSVAPVNIGGNLWDVHITGSPSTTPGTLIVNKTSSGGGDFQVDLLPIVVDITFNQLNSPTEITQTDEFIFDGAGVWSFNPGPANQNNANHPSGGLYIGVDPLTGEKAVTILTGAGASGTATHAFVPSMPTPAAAGLGLPLLGLLGVTRPRRQRAA